MKDPSDKYRWLIDEEAAAVVQRIFALTIEGNGPYDIARILFNDKVEAPAVYQARQGRGQWKSRDNFSNPYNWSGFEESLKEIPTLEDAKKSLNLIWAKFKKLALSP